MDAKTEMPEDHSDLPALCWIVFVKLYVSSPVDSRFYATTCRVQCRIHAHVSGVECCTLLCVARRLRVAAYHHAILNHAHLELTQITEHDRLCPCTCGHVR